MLARTIMHDAKLYLGSRPDRFDGLRESFQAVHTARISVTNPAIPEFGQDIHPELPAFIWRRSEPENILLSLQIDPDRNVDRAVLNTPFMP